MLLPEVVAEDGNALASRLGLSLLEDAADERFGPHHGEEVGRDILGLDVRGVSRPGQAHIGRTVHGQLFKGMVLALPVFVVGQRDRLQIAVILLLLDGQHTVHLGYGQGTQNYGVHDAVAGRIGADANGQREHRGQRESRRLAQLPHRVTQILKQGVHIISRFPRPLLLRTHPWSEQSRGQTAGTDRC